MREHHIRYLDKNYISDFLSSSNKRSYFFLPNLLDNQSPNNVTLSTSSDSIFADKKYVTTQIVISPITIPTTSGYASYPIGRLPTNTPITAAKTEYGSCDFT
mmetsp:Transcript_15473/g.16223  ORF Transcript_15473/g.16223 Transcript_15473/m.16223 type:complete len:102 (+) Transcript_15473:5-310(+)